MQPLRISEDFDDTEYILRLASNIFVALSIIGELMEKAPLGFKERNDIKRSMENMRELAHASIRAQEGKYWR
jgi:hypothetical protein